MKTGDVVNFVSPPGLMPMDTSGWKQQSPGLIVKIKENPRRSRLPSYEVRWKNGETTFEWESYLEIISKA
jgi:hypothetical protein